MHIGSISKNVLEKGRQRMMMLLSEASARLFEFHAAQSTLSTFDGFSG